MVKVIVTTECFSDVKYTVLSTPAKKCATSSREEELNDDIPPWLSILLRYVVYSEKDRILVGF